MKYRNPFNRLIKASIYSLEGLCYALKNEQAFQYEAVVLVILCIVLYAVQIEIIQGIFLAGMWLLVMAFELVNSAVEKAFDLIDINYRPEIKAGKDMLSGAVFVMVSFNIFTWSVIIIKALIQ